MVYGCSCGMGFNLVQWQAHIDGPLTCDCGIAVVEAKDVARGIGLFYFMLFGYGEGIAGFVEEQKTFGTHYRNVAVEAPWLQKSGVNDVGIPVQEEVGENALKLKVLGLFSHGYTHLFGVNFRIEAHPLIGAQYRLIVQHLCAPFKVKQGMTARQSDSSFIGESAVEGKQFPVTDFSFCHRCYFAVGLNGAESDGFYRFGAIDVIVESFCFVSVFPFYLYLCIVKVVQRVAERYANRIQRIEHGTTVDNDVAIV